MAGPAGAEVIPDIDPNTPPEGAALNDRGLTAEEQEQFDQMMRDTSGGPPAVDRSGDAPAGDSQTPPVGDDDDEDDDLGGEPEVVTPDPAAVADPAAATPKDGGKPPPKTVSYSKYLREREKLNKQMSTTAQALEKERADRIKLGERLAILNEALTVTAQPDPAANAPPANPFEEADIDPNEDVWKAFEQQARRTKFLAENLGGMQQETAEERASNELRNNFINDARSFASQTADYPAAYEYLKDTRLVEIAISEFDRDPREDGVSFTKPELDRIVQLFNDEEKWLAETNFRQGRSPASAIYKLARARGYQKAAPAGNGATPAPAPAPAARAANGAAAPAPRAPAKAPVVAEVQRLRQAAENGRSLSDGGSTSDVTSLTPDRLLSMTDDEFSAFVDKMPKRQLDALLGKEATQ